MKNTNKLIIFLLRPIIKVICLCFFNKKYLTGRHFENSNKGFLWCLRSIWTRNILRLAPPLPWPTALTCFISNPDNITFHPDNLDNFQAPGTYFQNFMGTISIGEGTYIAPNVGLITANHSLSDLTQYEKAKNIAIGKNCWIGMNAIILPGVELGPKTIVAAGAVVSKSFKNGNVVIGGCPAKLIKSV